MGILTSKLWTTARDLFPEISLSDAARFLPMLDLSRGELSSSAAIEIARVTRSDAGAIARRFVDALKPVCGGEWRVDAGYLIAVRVADDLLLSEARRISELFQGQGRDSLAPQSGRSLGGQLRQIVCIVPDVVTPAYARLRLIGTVGLQAILAVIYEGRVRLEFEPDGAADLDSVQGVVDLVRRAVTRVLTHEGEIRRDVCDRALPESAVKPGVVWTTHHYFDALSDSARQRLNSIREQGEILIRMPADGWLLSRERVLPELLNVASLTKVVERLSSRLDWLRWIFHAASPTSSGDFDPSVALYDECASPLWSISALVERFERLVSPISSAVSLPSAAQVPARWRPIVLRSVFLPVWSRRAVAEGDVAAWSQLLTELTADAHAFLNGPQLRMALARDAKTDEFSEILASLKFGLSSILPLVVTEER